MNFVFKFCGIISFFFRRQSFQEAFSKKDKKCKTPKLQHKIKQVSNSPLASTFNAQNTKIIALCLKISINQYSNMKNSPQQIIHSMNIVL